MTKKKNPDKVSPKVFEGALPPDFEKNVKQAYKKLTDPELPFSRYLEHKKEELIRLQELEANPSLRYQPKPANITPCGNGGFENSLNPAEWQGAYGNLPLAATNPFGSFTSGLLAGPISNANSRQTWVASGSDPNVGIPTTAPGSSGAVRIGNNIAGCGCELLSKTFVVTPAVSTIAFWYAVVLQNPIGHPLGIQPFLWVRVTDASGNIVPGAFDFGDGSDKLIADSTNPFFQVVGPESNPTVYKDWSCAQINLSSQIGKQVTIEFVTADCGACGHWGYAYIDNFCGSCKGSPTGNISYNCEESSHCGPGKLCFDYSLPTTLGPEGTPITGTVNITLDIYQNSAVVTQLQSPPLSRGTTYCFDIDSTTLSGVNSKLGGFDFVATGAFSLGSTKLGQISVGTAPDGVKPGQNNDYQIACKSCEEIHQEQDKYLKKSCAQKVNSLPGVHCSCPDSKPSTDTDCKCKCVEVQIPEMEPCISVTWGDSKCDGLESDDVEVFCIKVCNCYSNISFRDFTIGQIRLTDRQGNPIPVLPDGTPSVRVIPSGPICFGEIGPCQGRDKPTCVSRELMVYTRGAMAKEYLLSFSGICYEVTHSLQTERCFLLEVCSD